MTLPAAGDYAVAQLFLAHDSSERAAVLDSAKQQIQLNGFTVLGERTVPFIFENCGPGAQQSMPGFVQLIIERPADVQPGRPFEDQLYFLRRDLEKAFDRSSLSICSLSSQTIVYKGQLHAYQVGLFYPDLHDPNLKSAICLIHSRFSTNTFPSWDRAQPYRFLAHNGEINTLKGAENWMTSHGIAIYDEAASDSAKLENCMEYLYRHGRTIPEALLMLVPEAFEANPKLSAAQRAFDEYHASFVTPWDGPAACVSPTGFKLALTSTGTGYDHRGLR